MSLIGPRPPLTYHPWPIDEYTDEQRRMFNVRPGITGWAQIHGRKAVEWHHRIKGLLWFEKHARSERDFEIAKSLCKAKIGSRQLLFAKSYVQSGHTQAELVEELTRRGILERLQNLPFSEVMGYQVEELKQFQENISAFVRTVRKEAFQKKVGKGVLRYVSPIRHVRDHKIYPMAGIEHY